MWLGLPLKKTSLNKEDKSFGVGTDCVYECKLTKIQRNPVASKSVPIENVVIPTAAPAQTFAIAITTKTCNRSTRPFSNGYMSVLPKMEMVATKKALSASTTKFCCK